MKLYKKKTLTRACKIEGPFIVETYHGEQYVEDGYLAYDSMGFLYGIASEELNLSYEEAKDTLLEMSQETGEVKEVKETPDPYTAEYLKLMEDPK